ncbi:MAG: dienelactone hydrolase family protein [Hyphomicrobiaceae bacterium]
MLPGFGLFVACLALLCALQPGPLSAAAPQAASVDDCDRLASDRLHPGRVAPHVNTGRLDEAAAAACRADLARKPGQPRFSALLGRIYRALLRYDDARASYLRAAEAGDAYAMVEYAQMLRLGLGAPPDMATAFKWVKRAADVGSPLGLAELGHHYRFGLGVERNTKTFFELTSRAAALDPIPIGRRLGWAHLKGVGTPVDKAEADRKFRAILPDLRARAENGEDEARWELALMLLEGYGMPADAEQAHVWLQKAVADGHNFAIHSLAWTYEWGKGVARDLKKACDLYEHAASRGVIGSVNNLGLCFRNGNGRPKDMPRAIALFEKAAAAGNMYAARNLAQIFDGRPDWPADLAKAAVLFRLSADRGHTGAMVDYGYALTHGRGLPADTVAGCDWYERASAEGNTMGHNNLAICFLDARGRGKDVARGLALLERAVAEKNMHAMRVLGDYLSVGSVIPKDPVRAASLYKVSAEGGNVGAMVEFGVALTNGDGVERNEGAGCDWFGKASAAGNSLATNNLAYCFLRGEGRSKDEKQGIALLEQAVAKGSTVAMRNFAQELIDGEAIEGDVERAVELLGRAIEAKDASAVLRLVEALVVGLDDDDADASACKILRSEAAGTLSPKFAMQGQGFCWENGKGGARDAGRAVMAYERAARDGAWFAMRRLAVIHDEGRGIKRNAGMAARWLREALKVGDRAILTSLITAPHIWHRETLKALQRSLKNEGNYKGPLDGLAGDAWDEALWDHAIPPDVRGKLGLLKQTIVRVPVAGTSKGLFVRVCRSDDMKPGPLVVINHGSSSSPDDRSRTRADECGALAEAFARLGYVVAFPVRRGYSDTRGPYRETVSAAQCAARSTGLADIAHAIADDIEATITHLEKLPDVIAGQTLVVGHSGGGWGALALASRNPKNVRGYVNIAGGFASRKGQPMTLCPEALKTSARRLGRSARGPMLWIYTENDSIIGPAIARAIHQAYLRGGAMTRFEMLSAYGDEGHNVFGSQGLENWFPIFERWREEVIKPQ